MFIVDCIETLFQFILYKLVGCECKFLNYSSLFKVNILHKKLLKLKTLRNLVIESLYNF